MEQEIIDKIIQNEWPKILMQNNELNNVEQNIKDILIDENYKQNHLLQNQNLKKLEMQVITSYNNESQKDFKQVQEIKKKSIHDNFQNHLKFCSQKVLIYDMDQLRTQFIQINDENCDSLQEEIFYDDDQQAEENIIIQDQQLTTEEQVYDIVFQAKKINTQYSQIIPLSIKILQNEIQNYQFSINDGLTVYGLKVKFIIVCGILRKISGNLPKFSYIIDDYTGVIEAIYIKLDEDINILPCIKKINADFKGNMYVKCIIQLKSFRGKYIHLIHQIQEIKDFNELTNHLLQVNYQFCKVRYGSKKFE